jgi:ribose transport system ATP-binding protein
MGAAEDTLGKPAGGMMIETRKLVELARACPWSQAPAAWRITQSLSMNNRNRLYELIKRLRDLGRSVVVITHDVEELIRITDTITVLRDGEVVGEVVSAEATPEKIKRMMVGREISGDYYRADMTPVYKDEVVLSVRNLTVPGELEDVSFDVHEGEILGFCGLSDRASRGRQGGLRHAQAFVRFRASQREERLHDKATRALRTTHGLCAQGQGRRSPMLQASVFDNVNLPSLTEQQGRFGCLPPGRLKGLPPT